jgi:hypothetical protein
MPARAAFPARDIGRRKRRAEMESPIALRRRHRAASDAAWIGRLLSECSQCAPRSCILRLCSLIPHVRRQARGGRGRAESLQGLYGGKMWRAASAELTLRWQGVGFPFAAGGVKVPRHLLPASRPPAIADLALLLFDIVSFSVTPAATRVRRGNPDRTRTESPEPDRTQTGRRRMHVAHRRTKRPPSALPDDGKRCRPVP